jgi:hypothetical protein
VEPKLRGCRVALGKERGEDREKGGITQRLTYILFFCSVQPQSVGELIARVGGKATDIRSDIERLTQRLFIERLQNDGELFSPTKTGVEWMTTQVRQYYMMFGRPYVRRPPGLGWEEAILKLEFIIKRSESIVTAITIQMMNRCLLPVGRF